MKVSVRNQVPGTGKEYEILRQIRSLQISKRRSGFTLLEVMIALAIIGITLAVVLHTVNYHAEIMYQNTVTTQMYQMAKEKMYELEKNRANARGSLGPLYTFENRVTKREDSDVLVLTATVTGEGKEVSLTELVVREKSEIGSH